MLDFSGVLKYYTVMSTFGDKVVYGAGIAGAGWLVWMLRTPIMLFCALVFLIGITTYESPASKEEKRLANIALEQNWEKERLVTLKSEMRSGDLVAQTTLAADYLHNDDPSDNQLGMQLLTDAANKDCAHAQYRLGCRYYEKGDMARALKMFLLAAPGREERRYGTGSYKARGILKRQFPASYDSRWD